MKKDVVFENLKSQLLIENENELNCSSKVKDNEKFEVLKEIILQQIEHSDKSLAEQKLEVQATINYNNRHNKLPELSLALSTAAIMFSVIGLILSFEPDKTKVIIPLLLIIISGLITGIYVIFSLVRNKRKQNQTAYYVFKLSCIEELIKDNK